MGQEREDNDSLVDQNYSYHITPLNYAYTNEMKYEINIRDKGV